MACLMKTRDRGFACPRSKRRPARRIEAAVSEPFARVLVAIAGIYLSLGALFAAPFVVRGVERIDPVAKSGTWGFRVLIVPGVMLLWPLLAQRWARGSAHPPQEVTAHRRHPSARRRTS
jgi:hypothetical protein